MRQSFTDFTKRYVGDSRCAIVHEKITDNTGFVTGTDAGEREEFMTEKIREYSMNGALIIGVDNGYGNMKTARRCFKTAIAKYDSAPVLSRIISSTVVIIMSSEREERGLWQISRPMTIIMC